jgi:hypothetical protein
MVHQSSQPFLETTFNGFNFWTFFSCALQAVISKDFYAKKTPARKYSTTETSFGTIFVMD